MFGILKKKITAISTSTKNQDMIKMVEEIHNSFNTASDVAVKEALRIINTTPPPTDIALTMSDLGFINTPIVLAAKEREGKIKMAESEAKLIMHYQQTYPIYKFILERDIDIICKKYNLVFGNVNLYKGEVPEKNVKEIALFKKLSLLKDQDKSYLKRPYGAFEMVYKINHAQYEADMKYKETCRELSVRSHIGDYRHSIEEHFMICAPIKDMDTTGMRLEGYRLVEIPDPVVLYPCYGGYLIVSAWGPEASDEKIANQLMN